NVAGKKVVIALVKFQLFVVEIQIGEDAVFFHQEIRKKGRRRIGSQDFPETLLALQEKVHLRAKRGARFFVVKVGQKRIVFAVVNAAGMKTLGEDAGERGFADSERPFDGYETRSLRTPPGDGCALGRGVVRHWRRIIAAKMPQNAPSRKEI